MRINLGFRSLLSALLLLVLSHAAFAQIGIGISVNFGPPPLPVYEQPICPAEGYIWTPGYWAYDEYGGYYWVPGTWVMAPQVGFLWTPGYWAWGGGGYLFHEGYWGPHVGFYGGINYGFGYGGVGYEGGRWEGGHFAYNTYVNHVNTTIIHNTYNTTIINNTTVNRVSYNGGEGGVTMRPTPQEESFANERHLGPVPAQTQHLVAARSNPELRATANHGMPPIAATAKPGDFKSGTVASREAGGEYKAPPQQRPAQDASDLKPHSGFVQPNTGNDAINQKYQQQQQKLAEQQARQHQQLQQQQEKEHQQAEQKNYNDQQKQQMEQRHAQQTQQMEQNHAQQQHQMEQRQAPPPAPHGGGRPH